MNLDSKIYVAGHNGLVGSAITRNLRAKGYKSIITRDRKQLNLINRNEVDSFFQAYTPEYVFLAAAKVGGILANRDHKAEFIYENLMIQANVIDAAYRAGAKKLLFLGSSCIYPKEAKTPIFESEFMKGPLEPTNDAYAMAKIAGIKMCQSYSEQYGFNAIPLMPTNLYGPNDDFNPTSSHVLSGLLNRFHEAKTNNIQSVQCWGTGAPLREFLYVDDLAEACHFCMMNYNSPEIINVGTGDDITIRALAEMIAQTVGFKGDIVWDKNKPDGTYRKVLNTDKIKNLGWSPKISLEEGLQTTYEWYKRNINSL